MQQAEHLAERGVIDAVVAAEELPELLDLTLAVLVDPAAAPALPLRADADLVAPAGVGVGGADPGDRAARRTRAAEVRRPQHRRLNGTEEGEQDAAVLVALTRLDGQPCVLVGQDRLRQTPTTPLGPAALRQARRGMRLAEELGLPLVTVIDTPGAERLGKAEEGALAGEIARCIAALTTMTRPDRLGAARPGLRRRCAGPAPGPVVVAAENAWLAPLPPEGASVICTATSPTLPRWPRPRGSAPPTCRAGIVHEVVPELPEDDPETLATAVAAACGRHLHHAVSS